jgi:hypothetical protein
MALGAVAIAFAAFVFRDRVSIRPFAVVTAMGLMAYGLFWMSIFGVPTALGAYGGVPGDAALNPARALIGLLVDRAYGLLPIAPAFVALFLLKRPAPSAFEDSRVRLVESACVLAVLLPALFWRMWWGGQSPPARLIAPMTPFLALWLARLWAKAESPSLRNTLAAALAWSWALFLFAALQPERLLFINKRVRPTRLWEALWPGGPIDRILPDMARPESSDWTLAAVWLGAGIVASAVARRLRSSPST